jgi:hypothetical protein
MNDEFTARQRAITLRLAGRPVKDVCRTEAWFHKCRRRYVDLGAEGLYDLTRARHFVQRIPPEVERTILSIRPRLQAHAMPATRYQLVGAHAILAELKLLGIRPLPSVRTIGRALRRHGLTAPTVRLSPLLPRQEWPSPQALVSNQLHEVDLVGPVYLRRELARVQAAVNTQHVHPRLGGITAARHRQGLRLQKLPASFVVTSGRLPLAEGRVPFIRKVSVAGTVSVLSQAFRVRRRHRGLYLRLVIDTGGGWLTAYRNGRVLKRWPYKLLND